MKEKILRLLHTNESILKEIVKIDSLIPLEWNKYYNLNEKSRGFAYCSLKNELRRYRKICYYSCNDDTVIGFIIFSKVFHNKVKINSLWTHPSFRRNGYATRFKIHIEDWCRMHKIEFIQTNVDPKNKKMRNLNMKLGYGQKIKVIEKKLR